MSMMNLRATLSAIVIVCLCPSAQAFQTPASYVKLRTQLRKERPSLRRAFYRASRKKRYRRLEAALLQRIDTLHKQWVGSRWGLGLPQSTVPFKGKTNCGLFVAVVLRDAGFNLPIWKFNRQASYHGNKSLAPRRTRRYFKRAPMKRFLSVVRSLGPGLFLIGLDFHTGFLRVHPSGEVRFIHASYETRKVVDEPAATAGPIVTSKNRVIGKILQREMLRWWLERKRIHVYGNR